MSRIKSLALLGAAAISLAIASPVVAEQPTYSSGSYYDNSNDYSTGYGDNSRQNRQERTRRPNTDHSYRDNLTDHGISNCGIGGCDRRERSPERKSNITDYGISNCGIGGC